MAAFWLKSIDLFIILLVEVETPSSRIVERLTLEADFKGMFKRAWCRLDKVSIFGAGFEGGECEDDEDGSGVTDMLVVEGCF